MKNTCTEPPAEAELEFLRLVVRYGDAFLRTSLAEVQAMRHYLSGYALCLLDAGRITQEDYKMALDGLEALAVELDAESRKHYRQNRDGPPYGADACTKTGSNKLRHALLW